MNRNNAFKLTTFPCIHRVDHGLKFDSGGSRILHIGDQLAIMQHFQNSMKIFVRSEEEESRAGHVDRLANGYILSMFLSTQYKRLNRQNI